MNHKNTFEKLFNQKISTPFALLAMCFWFKLRKFTQKNCCTQLKQIYHKSLLRLFTLGNWDLMWDFFLEKFELISKKEQKLKLNMKFF